MRGRLLAKNIVITSTSSKFPTISLCDKKKQTTSAYYFIVYHTPENIAIRAYGLLSVPVEDSLHKFEDITEDDIPRRIYPCVTAV